MQTIDSPDHFIAFLILRIKKHLIFNIKDIKIENVFLIEPIIPFRISKVQLHQ